MRRIRIKKISALALGVFILCVTSVFADTVNLKLEVTNTSDTETKKLAVKTYLPKGIQEQDVADPGGFKITYDYEKSLYSAYQEVTLKAQETMSLKILLNDILIIPPTEINMLINHTQQIVNALEKTPDAVQVKDKGQQITDRLRQVLDAQNQRQNSTIDQRISIFELNKGAIKSIKKDIGGLEQMLIDSGGAQDGSVGAFVGEDNMSVDPLDDLNNVGKLNFRIEMSNSSSESMTTPLKYYLPQEVSPEGIINKGGLDVSYDFQRGVYYMQKANIALDPGQSKTFIVEVKDLWVIPEAKMDLIRTRAKKVSSLLEESPYKEPSLLLRDQIISILDRIIAVQNDKTVSVENHIGQYRLNLEKFDEARRGLAKMEKMLIQAGGTEAGLGKITAPVDSGSMKEGIRGARGSQMISKSSFESNAPDSATTWKVIWIILGFLGVVSFFSLILWWGQIKASFSRKYKDVQDNNTQS